jgi:hypothetical protein
MPSWHVLPASEVELVGVSSCSPQCSIAQQPPSRAQKPGKVDGVVTELRY